MKTVEIALSSCYDVAGGVFAPTTVRNGDTDYTITNIVASAFNRCANLTSVTLPNSITSIGDTAFGVCQNLTSVILPNSITSIDTGVFSACTNLRNITLPNTLVRLKQDAFNSCTSLTSITLPNTLISIGISVFSNTGLTSITLPNSITGIGFNAFRDCTSLITVSINKAIPLTISANAIFFGLTLNDLTLKVPVGSVSAYEGAAIWEDFGTIEGDTSLPPILFTISGVNYEITSVEDRTVEIAISSCYDVAGGVFALTEVDNATITYAITSIATAAFEDCTELTAFTFPSTVTSISFATFKGCTGLTSVTLPNSIREIGNNAFKDCTGLEIFSINKANPLVINANVFESASITSATLKVPTAGVSAYTSAAVWSGFGTKVADPSLTDGILNTESHVKENAFSIAINNNRLEIMQEDRALKINRVQIINLLGQVVKTSKRNSIALSNLPVGVYIVSIATKNGRFSKKFVRE